MLKAKLLSATAGAEEALAIEDVFSTYLYTGNGSTQTITNGIDLAGEGGLVWIKGRSGATDHQLFDTLRGATKELISNSTAAEATDADTLTAFNADGFSLGADATTNTSAATYASWTFRKAPRFFDVVTYTGNGTSKTISHNLGVVPGMVIVKRTDSSDAWCVNHRYDFSRMLFLNLTSAATLNSPYSGISVTDTTFTVNGGTAGQGDIANNSNGDTYVAYLFAHDPLGPSGDGSDGLIACGSFSGNTTVSLGWEPQWILLKRSDSTGGWFLHDTMRGWPVSGDARYLYANTSDVEGGTSQIYPNATGFSTLIGSGTYIYIAIRRGPMRAPESGTEVFDADTGTYSAAKLTTGFDTDLLWQRARGSVSGNSLYDRMRGSLNILQTNSTSAETPNFANGVRFDQSEGVFVNDGANDIHYAFRRAPEFFDVVAYTGNNVNGRTVPHNLGVAPEMVITKSRNGIRNWVVYTASTGISNTGRLNSTAAFGDESEGFFASPSPSSLFLKNNNATNSSGINYIAYLFASKAGVSKVGSYTGNGTSQTINCGFTTGARFILIKRTDSTGDWYVWDTARGIVAANDPHLSLNTTAAEVTTDDSVDPDNSGFIVNQVAATNINVSSASYIFYAVS